MVNTPWDTGSPLYRKLVIAALGLTGLGIILVIIAVNMSAPPLVYTALGLIVVGLGCHLTGLVIRGRDARRRIKAQQRHTR